jgi:hypothetical protein
MEGHTLVVGVAGLAPSKRIPLFKWSELYEATQDKAIFIHSKVNPARLFILSLSSTHAFRLLDGTQTYFAILANWLQAMIWRLDKKLLTYESIIYEREELLS